MIAVTRLIARKPNVNSAGCHWKLLTRVCEKRLRGISRMPRGSRASRTRNTSRITKNSTETAEGFLVGQASSLSTSHGTGWKPVLRKPRHTERNEERRDVYSR